MATEVTGTAAATVYFVASEALANIAKHADATTIRLTATTEDGRVTLADRGRRRRRGGRRGFGSAQVWLTASRPRVERSTSRRRPSGGTRLSAVVPLD